MPMNFSPMKACDAVITLGTVVVPKYGIVEGVAKVVGGLEVGESNIAEVVFHQGTAAAQDNHCDQDAANEFLRDSSDDATRPCLGGEAEFLSKNGSSLIVTEHAVTKSVVVHTQNQV